MRKYIGWRGIVEVEVVGGQKIAKKIAKDKTKKGAINKEVQILRYLEKQDIDFVPKILDSGDGWFSYEWIEGEHFRKERRDQNGESKNQKGEYKKKLVLNLLKRAYQLDCVGVVHGEFIRPYTNIIVKKSEETLRSLKKSEDNRVNYRIGSETGMISDNHQTSLETSSDFIFIIDFERGRLGDFSGKNMRSLSQRLCAQGYLTIDDCKYIGIVDRKEMYQFLQKRIESGDQPDGLKVEKKTKMMNKIQNSGLEKNNKFLALSFLFLAFLALLFLDQGTKYLFYDLKRGEEYYFFTPAFNTGVGWSIPVPLNISIGISIIMIGFVSWLGYKKQLDPLISIFIIAGAIGNALDRVFLGGVRDFIDFHYRPIFNLADIYLTIAGILLLWHSLFNKEHNIGS